MIVYALKIRNFRPIAGANQLSYVIIRTHFLNKIHHFMQILSVRLQVPSRIPQVNVHWANAETIL